MDLTTLLLSNGVPAVLVVLLFFFNRDLRSLDERVNKLVRQVYRLDKKAAVTIARVNNLDGQHGAGEGYTENDGNNGG